FLQERIDQVSRHPTQVSAAAAPVCTLTEMEKIMLLRALALANGNRTKAAKILGVARSTLFEMIKRHRIKGPRATNQNHTAYLTHYDIAEKDPLHATLG